MNRAEEEPKQLYTVLEPKANAIGGALMGSTHVYDMEAAKEQKCKTFFPRIVVKCFHSVFVIQQTIPSPHFPSFSIL